MSITGKYYGGGSGKFKLEAEEKTITAPFNIEKGKPFYKYHDVLVKSSESIPGLSNSSITAFSPDRTELVVISGMTVTIYRKNGNTYTPLSGIQVLPTYGSQVCFSPDGNEFLVAHSATPYFSIYRKNGNTYSRLTGLPTLSIVQYPWQINFSYSTDGNEFAILWCSGSSNIVSIFRKKGETYESAYATGIAGRGIGISYSPDGSEFAVIYAASPYISIFRKSGSSYLLSYAAALSGTPSNIITVPDGSGFAVAYWGTSSKLSVYLKNGSSYGAFTINGFNQIPYKMCYSPDGKDLVIQYTLGTDGYYIAVYKKGNYVYDLCYLDRLQDELNLVDLVYSPNGKEFSAIVANKIGVLTYRKNKESYFKTSVIKDGIEIGTRLQYTPDSKKLILSRPDSSYMQFFDREDQYSNELSLTKSCSMLIPQESKANGQGVKVYEIPINNIL